MLIKALLDLVYYILDLFAFMELPSMPDVISSFFSEILNYISVGISILRGFIGETAMSVVSVLLTLIISVNSFYFLWSLVFWILRKIPMLNIKE